MDVPVNCPRTPRTTSEDQCSNITINVNGGNVYLLNNPDKRQELSVVISKKKKHGAMSRLMDNVKRWAKKKFTRSAKVVTKQVQESSCDATGSTSLELKRSAAEEHSFKNEVMPVQETEYDRSVLAGDGHLSNHSLDCINVNDILSSGQFEQPTSQPGEYPRSARCLPSGNFPSLNHDTSETYLKRCEYTEVNRVKQLELHPDDLHIVQPFSSQLIPVDESTNTHDKSVNDVSPDVVNSWSERSFSSGYPDETISSQCYESTHLLSDGSLSNRMFGRNPELENKEGCQEDQCVDDNLFQSKTGEEDEESELNNLSSIEVKSFQSKPSEADEERELKDLSSRPWTNAPLKLTRKPMSDSLGADDISTCADSCSSRDTNADKNYAVHITKIIKCLGFYDLVRCSEEIESFSPEITDKRVGKRTLSPFCHDTFISWLMTLLWNKFTTLSIYQASLGTKPSDKTQSSGTNGDDTVRMTSLLLKQNDLITICGVRCLDLSLVSQVGLNIHFSYHQYSQVVDLEEYNVPVSARKNLTIRTEECLTIAVFQKQTVHNAMNDGTIKDSRPVSDIESSDLDFVRKGKFSDKLVVTEEGPFGNQTESFSHSTLPSACDVDVVAAQKKKTRKCKKKYRKKCKKSELSHGVTSSLASFLLNDFFSDDNSIPFGYHHSNHQAPRRRKGSPENAKPPSRDSFDIKQSCSNLADSGIGESLGPVSFSWFTYDVDSIVIACHKRKKKIGSFGSWRHVKNSYSFKKQCNTFFRNQLTKKLKSIVRELRVDHRYLEVPHFGLGSYFDRLNNGSPPSLQEQMRYEWIRLASFQHYTGAGNALNLARNGFYHRHTDGPTSTRCAYCDETRSNWEYFDNTETVHRQMSPNCPFHGDESLNEAINTVHFTPSAYVREVSDVNRNTVNPSTIPESVIGQVDSREHSECFQHQPGVTSSSSMDQNHENSACRPYTLSRSLTLASPVYEVVRELENISVSQANTNGESVSQQPTEDSEGSERRTDEPALPPVNTESRSNRAQAGAGNFVGKHAPQTPAPVNRDSTPTALENVKHPEYRTMAQRVNSFQGFPDYLDQTPEQMALAGFYFVGVADFTRCFCCGGGVRNWEAGDDPLLEHTRWFPRCEYVLRLKGERYVAAVQRRHQEHMEQQRRQQIEIANQRDANRYPPDPMTTDAASVMREMGYADQRIRETILAVRRQIGTHMVTTQQVLSWLLDEDDDSTTTAAASSLYQTGLETNSIYTGINMAREEDDSNYTTAAPSSINTTVSTTAVNTRESVRGSGSNNATAASSGNGNQQTDTKSTAPGADASLVSCPSSQTGAKRNGKKKKGNTKTGQPAGATGSPGTDAARKLQTENEQLRDMQTCKVCMERPVNTTMLPCGHLVCCDICASRLRNCPVCRKKIKGTVKTFMS